MRSPFESEERAVGEPRAVVGDAAQMASVMMTDVVSRSFLHVCEIDKRTRSDGHGCCEVKRCLQVVLTGTKAVQSGGLERDASGATNASELSGEQT